MKAEFQIVIWSEKEEDHDSGITFNRLMDIPDSIPREGDRYDLLANGVTYEELIVNDSWWMEKGQFGYPARYISLKDLIVTDRYPMGAYQKIIDDFNSDPNWIEEK